MNKLIRDKLPERYNLSKKQCKIEEYPFFLGLKLIEESKEVVAELKPSNEPINRVRLIEELADVREVYETLIKMYDIDIEEIKDIQNAKRILKGGFKEGYILDDLDVEEK